MALPLTHSTQASHCFLLLGTWDPTKAQAMGCPCVGETLFPGRRCVTAWGVPGVLCQEAVGISDQLCPGVAEAWVPSRRSAAGSGWNR